MTNSDFLWILLFAALALVCFYYGKQYVLSETLLVGHVTGNINYMRYGIWKLMRQGATVVIPGGASMERRLDSIPSTVATTRN